MLNKSDIINAIGTTNVNARKAAELNTAIDIKSNWERSRMAAKTPIINTRSSNSLKYGMNNFPKASLKV
jgi:hypothetical protein